MHHAVSWLINHKYQWIYINPVKMDYFVPLVSLNLD